MLDELQPKNAVWTAGVAELGQIKFRLTRKEILLVYTGLQPAICSYAQAREFGQLPFTSFFRVYPHLRPPHGKFRQELMDFLMRLWSVICGWVRTSESRTHRMETDAIGVAALAFFARASMAQIRHGHLPSPVTNPKLAIARLTRKLERYRRRALRSCERSGRGRTYARASSQWRDFLTWVRSHLLYCQCRLPIMTSHRRRQVSYLARIELLARDVVREQHLEMPTEKELHRLVRLCVAYARRGRLNATLLDLLKGNGRARYVLGRFLRKRLQPSTLSHAED